MRGNEPSINLGLVLGGEVMDEILNRPPRPEVPASGRLETDDNGKVVGRDIVFTADVDADGHVSKIHDKPNVRVKVHIPDPRKIPGAVVNHLDRWSHDPYGVSGRGGSDAYDPDVGPGKPPKIKRKTDGRVYTIISGGFDINDALERWAGNDPYNPRKRAFLEETFDERVEMGRTHRAREYAQADQTMLGHLRRLWATELELAEKRELVFELWDECTEPGAGVSDAEAEAGARARAALLRFVRTELPEGEAGAYGADELSRLNQRRQSKARFAPYARDDADDEN